MARVIITGGCGFIGQLVARSVIRRGALRTHNAASEHGAGGEWMSAVKEVVLVDVARPEKLLFDELESTQHDEFDDPCLESRVELGDVSDASFCKSLLAYHGDGPISIFHLGAIMSGQGEADFDLAMRVNLHGTINMLEAARHCGAPRPKFVMSSAGATLGAGAPTDWVAADDVVSDATRATPHTSYGMTKACAELLMADYSRRGFVDGRAVRLPTVAVRAGAPNAATTSCYSGVAREPLAGVDAVAPIAPHVKHAVTGHRTAVECIMTLHDVPADEVDATLGFDRTVFVPSRPTTLAEIVDATRRIVSSDSVPSLGAVTYDVDEKVSAAVGSFPAVIDASRALRLGMPPCPEIDEIVRAYAEDFPDALAPGVRLA